MCGKLDLSGFVGTLNSKRCDSLKPIQESGLSGNYPETKQEYRK